MINQSDTNEPTTPKESKRNKLNVCVGNKENDNKPKISSNQSNPVKIFKLKKYGFVIGQISLKTQKRCLFCAFEIGSGRTAGACDPGCKCNQTDVSKVN